ncbi:hypothetical protein ES705_50608 [subsurface metagenome]
MVICERPPAGLSTAMAPVVALWRSYAVSTVLKNPTRLSIGVLAMKFMAHGKSAIKLLKNTLELLLSLAK